MVKVDRYLTTQVNRDLARSLPGGEKGYLNWDAAEHRERILRREL